jgi:hypothetical protein
VRNKGKILLTFCVLSLILFLEQSKIMNRGAILDSNTPNTPPVKKPIDNTTLQPASERDFLSMPLEELMQIPVATASRWKNNGNFLDMPIEELMEIPVTGSTPKQQLRI